MSAQTRYGYKPPVGVPGSLYDISPYAMNSRSNGETEAGALRFGMGVMQGNTPGQTIRKPTASSRLSDFEGVAMTGFTSELDMDGRLMVPPDKTVNVLRWGRAWVKVEEMLTIAYGEPVYLITRGANAGLFTNIAAGNMKINATFIGGLGSTDTAPIELYNQKND